MAFRIMNPGYAEFLDNHNGATTVENATYGKNGVSFYTGSGSASQSTGYQMPYNPTELWCKFNIYVKYPKASGTPSKEIGYLDSVSTYSSNFTGVRFYASNNSYYVYIMVNGANKASIAGNCYYSWDDVANNTNLKGNAINEILLHIKPSTTSSATDGLIEVTINGKLMLTAADLSTPWSGTYNVFRIFGYNPIDFLVSDIILSDEEISYKEQIIPIPVSATETTMSVRSGGIYVADAVGQTLLQTVDAESLIDDYGADSEITGIMTVGNPAYRTGEVVSSLIGISKENGTITEHGTHTLSTDETGMVADARKVTNTTIADLDGVQLGWKSGE